MSGFDPKFKDLPDYILKITKEIWEDRGITTLNHYYAKDIVVRMPEGVSRGNQATINATLATLAQFPDRQLTGEDVIWSGNESDGFLSSHRLLTMGTHTGHGYFGVPTGKRFTARAIADCAVVGNQVIDEWLIRDTAGIACQLGIPAKEFARRLILRERKESKDNKCIAPFTPAIDIQGPYKGTGNDNQWGQEARRYSQRHHAKRHRHHRQKIRPRGADRAPLRHDCAFLGGH